MCSGLEELHSRGVVHRDLKPDNVLFRTNGEPVIVDLGIAKIQSTGNPHGEITVVEGKSVGVGTVGYAAPEQFSGGVITPAADIHALGVLAERLISGASSGIYDNWAWRRIIRRATSSIPSERYQTVREFASAIRRRHGVRYSLYGLCAAVVFAALFWSVAELLASGGRFMGRTSMDIEPKVARFWQMDADHVGYSYMPSVIELGDMTRVMDRQMRIKAGHVCKVIGPGVLDAQIVGPDSATLWMTNCVVLNRAKRIYPDVGLKYELAGDAYLNFIKVGRPDGVNETNYVTGISGWCNDLRYRGPETRVDLMSLKNLEWFQSQVR